jgi:hypothetical protein
VTTTSIGKRAAPTELLLEVSRTGRDSTSINGLGGLSSSSGHSNVGATSEIASDTPVETTTSKLPLPIQSTTPVMPFIAPVPIPSKEPPAPTEAVATQAIAPRQAQTEANTMAATRSTSTLVDAVTITNILTSVIASTTTVVTTSTNIETIFQTNTV